MLRPLAIALAVAVVTFALFLPVRDNELVKWDDDLYLFHAAEQGRLTTGSVRWAFTTLVPFYYHPLTWLSHIADHQFWGANLRPQHTLNILIHCANVALATCIVWTLFAHWPVRDRSLLAGMAALLFGIHPLQVESVAWLAERKNLLCGFFSGATVLAYLQTVRQPAHYRLWHLAAICLFAAALLAKPMAVPLPLVLLLLDWQPLRRLNRATASRCIIEKLPLFALSIVVSALTVIGQALWGAVKDAASFGIADRLLVAARGYFFYLWKFIWPTWFSPYYPLGQNPGLHNPEFLIAVTAVLAITAIGVCLVKRQPAILAAWLMYLVLLAPTSGLVQTGGQGAADRFVYLALLVATTITAAGAIQLARLSRPAVAALLGLVFVVYAAGLALRTHLQIPVWRTEETLWRHVLQYYPNAGIARFHLAMALLDQRRLAEALPHAQLASQLIPDNALARSTTGLLYLKARDYSNAHRELQAAVLLDSQLAAARYNLACAQTQLGRYPDALRQLAQALAQRPALRELARREPALQPLREHPEFGAALATLLTAH